MREKDPHRPLALDPDQEADIVRFIRELFRSQNYATQRDMLTCVDERFKKTLTYRSMTRFLDRHKSEMSGVTAVRQEKVTLEVPRSYFEEYLTLIKKIVPIIPTELLYNLDETGFSEWENRRGEPVLVPTQEQESTLHYPVDRSVRHDILFCCVTASKDSYCPMVITPTASTRKHFDTGVRHHIDPIIEVRQPAYTAAELFHRYITEVFFPALETNPQLPGCENKLCILFCDNCSIHCQDQLLKEFAEIGVAVVTYSPHKSHLFQVLDLVLFGRLKTAKKYIPRADADPTDTDHLVRIVKTYELVTASTRARSPWKKAGFESCKLDDTSQLLIYNGKIRDSPEFAEIWRMTFPLEGLSARRIVRKWGFMSRQFFKGRYLKILRQQGLD
jgi:hypothetical protein